jgi:hypothetical protein
MIQHLSTITTQYVCLQLRLSYCQCNLACSRSCSCADADKQARRVDFLFPQCTLAQLEAHGGSYRHLCSLFSTRLAALVHCSSGEWYMATSSKAECALNRAKEAVDQESACNSPRVFATVASCALSSRRALSNAFSLMLHVEFTQYVHDELVIYPTATVAG